jgi:DNA replication factor GINS
MQDNNIYERLLELWTRERSSETLTKIPEELIKELSTHVSLIRRQLKLSERGSINAALRNSELHMIQRILESLFKVRLRKIMTSGASDGQLENLLSFERRFYNILQRALQSHLDSVKSILSNPLLLQPRKESKYEVVIFLKQSPRIVGEDLVSYGPFQEGDIASLPVENANLLARRNIVRRVQLG